MNSCNFSKIEVNAKYENKNKTSKSNVNCAVYGCLSVRKKNNDLSYHIFPKAGEKIQVLNEVSGKVELCDKLKLWESRVRMGKKVTRFMKICSLHFKDEDYTFSGWSSIRLLRSTAVPSQNLPFNFLKVLSNGNQLIKRETCFSDKKASSRQYELANADVIEHTIRLANIMPWNYLGLQKECMFLIDLIHQYTQLDTASIFLTLQKIRLAQTFSKLGDDYGMSENAATITFLKSVSLISKLMDELIIWPSKEKIQALLPAPFRTECNNVQCIINCLEIEIKKPRDAVRQTLTWSHYKKANTLKYLVSSTPDGVVNFISTAFGGRTSDAVIVEKSGFLDRLQPGTVIMADKGFERIEKLLTAKQCTLLRAPSDDCDQNVLLRIHMEQVIRRLQEFDLLKKHSCVTSQLTQYMDFITVIACGLINLQRPIIKR